MSAEAIARLRKVAGTQLHGPLALVRMADLRASTGVVPASPVTGRFLTEAT